jgi:hypothetical protein
MGKEDQPRRGPNGYIGLDLTSSSMAVFNQVTQEIPPTERPVAESPLMMRQA